MEELVERKSWFNRNWKWVLPTGGCLLAIILIVAFAGSIIWGVTSLMSDSQAYQDAMDAATNNPKVVRLLGEPVEPDGMTGGSVHYSNGYGTAELTIPIKGPNGKGTIRVEGSGVKENWTYEKMEVLIAESDEIIDLLEEMPSIE
ncbi:MAG: hypothetical protein DWP94_10115 [Flavobacterium sp.]|nr:MAG: hypothetical protein DWP94_10115 [Flavobacterium sp.]